MTRKTVAALMVTALAVAVAAGLPAPASARISTSTLVWADCPPPLLERDRGQQCATVSVPLDYQAPHGRTVDLVVSRIAAKNLRLRRGVLMLNTGGPGDVGVDSPSFYARLMPPAVLDRYDLIGVDLRGIGYSAPISCDFPPAPVDVAHRFPGADGSIDRNIAYAQELARRCAANGGEVLPTVTTANWARDMDAIRAALRQTRISFLGYSYGTYLGAVYRTMFPHRADRFVLDSSYDPALTRYEQLRLANLGATCGCPTSRHGPPPVTTATTSAPRPPPSGRYTTGWSRGWTAPR
jgi:pimeloyl-ACP methyl ester carboxylesterase